MSTAAPVPFKIHVPDELLEQTKRKLELARLPDQLLNVVWEGTLRHEPHLIDRWHAGIRGRTVEKPLVE